MTSKILAATAIAGGLAVGGAAQAQSVGGVVGGVTGGGVGVTAPGVNVSVGAGGSAGAFGGASPGLAPGGLGMVPGGASLAPMAPSSVSPRASGSGYAVSAVGANATVGQPGFGRPAVHGPLPMPGAFPTVRWSETRSAVRSTADANRARLASNASAARAKVDGKASAANGRAQARVGDARSRADKVTLPARSAAARAQTRTDARVATPVRTAAARVDGAAQARAATAKTRLAPATDKADRVTARLNRQATRGVMLAQARAPASAVDNQALAARVRAAADDSASLRSRLADLSPGMVVRDTRGQRIGVVSRIVRSGGTIRSVLVTAANGARRTALSPHSLSISGGVVTTTQFGARSGS